MLRHSGGEEMSLLEALKGAPPFPFSHGFPGVKFRYANGLPSKLVHVAPAPRSLVVLPRS